MPETSYVKYEAMKKLGDRAFASKDYEKAIGYYEQAIQAFNIPNHPKTLAALEGIRKSKNALSAGSSRPKPRLTDGLVKPAAFHLRLYCNKQLPEDNWIDFVIRAFEVSREGVSALKKMVLAAEKIPEFHESWEFVPYFHEGFKKVAEERSRTYLEDLSAGRNEPLARTFVADVQLMVHDQLADGVLFIAVFGNELE